MANVFGTDNSETIDMLDGVTNGADFIFALGGNDSIFGLGGNDHIKGGGGADTINGGSGIDTASYLDSDASVIVSLAAGRGFGGYANDDTLISIENLTGSTHSDVLIGNEGTNVLNGLAGNDRLKGGGGADVLDGGAGIDTVSYVDSSEAVFVSLGDNIGALGDAEGDQLYDIENVIGSAHDDTLLGDAGVNVLRGNDGNDTYYVDDVADVVIELAGQGNDTVFSTANAYTLSSFVETLSLDTATDAGVYGTGNAQANTIYGNINDNILEGGGGADILNGLGGNDNFVFRPGDANGDVIHEFAGNGAGVGDFMYFIGYGTAAEGASFVQLTATTWQINSADGLTHDVITLAGGPAVDPGDFVFI